MADEETKAENVKAAAPVSKIDAAAEKAYAEAAAKKVEAPKAAAVEKAPAAEKAKPAEKAPAAEKASMAEKVAAAIAAPSPEKTAAPKPERTKIGSRLANKVAAANTAVKKRASKVAKPVAAPAATVTSTPATSTIAKLKEKIMETANTTDFTATAKDMAADLQTRVQGAYAKTAEMASEAADFGKGNVEAVVESGKIFISGAQELVRDDLETGKTVIETVTADAKKMMEIKSPTELMQMQGELVRRNFDAIVSFGSKRTEAWLKLYNDAFAPISNRVSIAAEKVTKAA